MACSYFNTKVWQSQSANCAGGMYPYGDGSVLHTVVTSDLVDIASGYWTLNEDDVWSYFILFVCLIYPGMQADRGM